MKKQKLKTLNTDEIEMLWIGAFRYYLGRMTMSTHSFGTALSENWLEIPDRAQVVIVRELKEAIKQDDDARSHSEGYKPLGHDCDSEMWREVFRRITSS